MTDAPESMAVLTARCHCGAVSIELPGRPPTVTECNCSICRRYGARWAYFRPPELRFTGHPAHTAGYSWGERRLRFVHCRHCGCVTHWESLAQGPEAKVGVNVRLLDPSESADLRVRRFDGADTWRFLD